MSICVFKEPPHGGVMFRMACVLFALAIAFVSCNEAKMSGGNGTTQPAVAGGPSNPAQTPPPGGCVSGDQVTFIFPPAIQECINRGMLYLFTNNTCSNMRKADFPCSFDDLKANLIAMNFGGSRIIGQIDDAKARNAKLLGCGQSADKQRIVGQWFFPGKETVNCSFQSEQPLTHTVCLIQNDQTPEPTTPEAMNAAVADCMLRP